MHSSILESNSVGLGSFLDQTNFFHQAAEIVVTPKTLARHKKSNEIASTILKSSHDHKLYLIESAKPKEIGGDFYDEQIENKVVASQIGTLFQELIGGATPPFHYWKINMMSYVMKFSKIKAYEMKRATYSAKRWLPSRSLTELLEQKE